MKPYEMLPALGEHGAQVKGVEGLKSYEIRPPAMLRSRSAPSLGASNSCECPPRKPDVANATERDGLSCSMEGAYRLDEDSCGCRHNASLTPPGPSASPFLRKMEALNRTTLGTMPVGDVWGAISLTQAVSLFQNVASDLPEQEKQVALALIAAVEHITGEKTPASVWNAIGGSIRYGSDFSLCDALRDTSNSVWDWIWEITENDPIALGIARWYRNCELPVREVRDPCHALGLAYATCNPPSRCPDAFNAHQDCIQEWGILSRDVGVQSAEQLRFRCRDMARRAASRYGVPGDFLDAIDTAAVLDHLASTCTEMSATVPLPPSSPWAPRGGCGQRAYEHAVSYGLLLLVVYGVTGVGNAVQLALYHTARMIAAGVSGCASSGGAEVTDDPDPSRPPRPHRP